MSNETMETAVVFVGCGGTFWTASPYFSALLREMKPALVWTVDPDRITKKNRERQWCNLIVSKHRAKAACAMEAVSPLSDLFPQQGISVQKFNDWSQAAEVKEAIWDKKILLIVNVDNDKARLDIRKWAIQHSERVVMVLSGCDKNFGQVYYGVYGAGEIVHDWLPLHSDVGKRKKKPGQTRQQGCADRTDAPTQTAMSNCLTGALFAPAIDDARRFLELNSDTTPKEAGEFYWRRDGGGRFRSWSQFSSLYCGEAVAL